MPKPTDRAIAQAFREWRDPSYFAPAVQIREAIYKRAREIDAAAPAGAQAPVAMYQVRPVLGDGSWGHWREATKRDFDNNEDDDTGYPPDRWERRKLYTAPPAASEDAVDAARYRWLRDECNNQQYLELLGEAGIYPENYKVLLEGPALDAAIDAARDGEGVG